MNPVAGGKVGLLVILGRPVFYYDLPKSCPWKSAVSSVLRSNCKFKLNDEQRAARTGVAAFRTASHRKRGLAAQIAKSVMGAVNGRLRGGLGFGQSAGGLLVRLDVADPMLAEYAIREDRLRMK